MERKTITVNQEIAAIIEKAAGVWPELAHNTSALIGKIIADWDRIRAEGGGKGQQINARLDRHEEMLNAHTAMLERICAALKEMNHV